MHIHVTGMCLYIRLVLTSMLVSYQHVSSMGCSFFLFLGQCLQLSCAKSMEKRFIFLFFRLNNLKQVIDQILKANQMVETMKKHRNLVNFSALK